MGHQLFCSQMATKPQIDLNRSSPNMAMPLESIDTYLRNNFYKISVTILGMEIKEK